MTRAAWVTVLMLAVTLSATVAVGKQGTASPPAQRPATQSASTYASADDVHVRAGLTCSACHDAPLPGSSADRPVFPTIARTAIAPLCARCHADASYMRQFAPQVRVDQFAQYQTSVHGQQMAKGQDKVATCSDCHQAHGILQVRDSRSPVAPSNVARTCERCHSDAARMAPFRRSPEVFADWSKSVHANALLERGDASAPTCSTCHGSHGATPPGVDAVANVCAQCHVREAELFRASAKKDIFASLGQADCLVCHQNHAIVRPDDTWIGLDPPAVCADCHDASSSGADVIRTVGENLRSLDRDTNAAAALVTQAEEAGVLVEEGHLAIAAAREAHVQGRVLVHAFATPPFQQVLTEGRAAVQKAHEAGQSGLRELRFRRTGLAVATLFILGFLGTLYFKIRSLPPIPE